MKSDFQSEIRKIIHCWNLVLQLLDLDALYIFHILQRKQYVQTRCVYQIKDINTLLKAYKSMMFFIYFLCTEFYSYYWLPFIPLVVSKSTALTITVMIHQGSRKRVHDKR